MRYTNAVLLPLVPAPKALSITGTDAPIPIPMMIGNAMSNSTAPVMARACRIPTAALALWITAVIRSPTRTPSMGFLKLMRSLMKFSSSLKGEMAADIMLMPYMRTAKPIMIPPMFLRTFFLLNIHKAIPIKATMPVRISVLKNVATDAPEPPRLFKQRIHPVILVPKIAPSIMPMAWRTFIIPEFTKPTTMTDVADDDCMTAVTPVPRTMPFTGFPASLNSIISIFDPASFFKESPITDIPKRKSAIPPKSETMLLTSIFFL